MQLGRRLAVLISGRGSNLQSIIDAIAERSARCDDRRRRVESSRCRRSAARARGGYRSASHLNPREFASRDAYDRAIADLLRARHVDLVCLAGFMRLVGACLARCLSRIAFSTFTRRCCRRFPGLEAQRQALEHGVRVSGATVHLVTTELDAGPILLQAAVPVLDDDTVDALSARILVEEHRIYPEAIRLMLDGRWQLNGRRFIPST